MSKNTITVESPIALGELQLEKIIKVMKKITGEDFVVKNVIEQDMLGGMKLKFGTRVIDLSFEKMIKEMEQELNE